MKVTRYCTCGAFATLVAPEHDKEADEMWRTFWRDHTGPDHQECDAATARRARQRAESVEVKRA